jgi:hypothetical protein
MSMSGRSSELTEAAEAAGLGVIHHVHRRHNRVDGPVGTVVAIGGAGLLWLATASRWLALVLCLLAGIAGLVAWVLAGGAEPEDLTHPARIAVADGGLVLDGGPGRVVAVPWAQILGTTTRFPTQTEVVQILDVTVRDHGRFPVEVGPYGDRSALMKAVAAQGPVPVTRRGLAVAVALGALVAGFFVAKVVLPDYRTKVVDERPSAVGDLAAVCRPPGAAFTALPAYEGPAPHPVAVFVSTSTGRDQPPVADVQLVACDEHIGQAFGGGVTCQYSTSNVGIGGRIEVQTLDRGRWRLTLHEARTHRRVAETEVDGADETCPEYKRAGDDVYTKPSEAQVRQFLEPHVQR